MSRTPPVVPDLPELSSTASLGDVIGWLQQLRTATVTREPIATGDKLQKFVTRGELVGLNVLDYSSGTFGVGSLAGGGSEVIGGGTGPVYDDSPPDAITGLTVTGMLTHFLVEFDAPTYTQGGGNAYTEIYAANYAGTGALPTFADAVLVYELSGSTPIAAIPAQPAQTTCFWVGAVTRGGIRQVDGVGPTGGLHGAEATTGADVSGLLTVLTNQIQESQLFSTLGARIDLVDALAAVPGSVNARIATEASSRASADSSLATSISTVSASTATNAAAITTEATARASADSSLASSISSVSAVASGAAADIVTEASARASADSSLASSISTLSSTVSGNTAAISTEASTRASADGSLFAQYTVKLDTNGYVSGFGLASTSTGAAPYSEFIIRADSFSISNPAGPGISPITPFIVVTTTTTINGVSVPVGVYMDAAYIANGTITNAKIGNAAIDDAKIANLSAAKITAGSIAVGEYLQSTGYVSGSSGWRITGNGVAEFAAASIRGQLTASQIGVTSLDALSATIGTLRTATTGARMEIKDNKIGVFDSSNVLRVRIGDLSGTF